LPFPKKPINRGGGPVKKKRIKIKAEGRAKKKKKPRWKRLESLIGRRESKKKKRVVLKFCKKKTTHGECHRNPPAAGPKK